MSNKIKILLTASLALNILLIGISIGQISGKYMIKRQFRADFKNSIQNLSEEKASLVKKTMRNLHKETKTTRKEIKKTRKNIYKIITAPSFNEAAYDKEVDKLDELHGEIMGYFSNATKDLAGQLDQDERKVIAEILKQRDFKHRRHHGHGLNKTPAGIDQPPPF